MIVNNNNLNILFNGVAPVPLVAFAAGAAMAKAAEVFESAVGSKGCDLGSQECISISGNMNRLASVCRIHPASAYSSGLAGRLALEKTPEYTHRLMHPGLFFDSNGKAGYAVKEGKLLREGEFKQYHRQLLQYIQTTPGLKEQVQEMCGSSDPDSKGCAFMVGEEQLLLKISPLKMANHKQAVASFRSWIGKIDSLSEGEIVSKIQEAHALLMNGLQPKEYTGRFRDQDSCIFQDNAEDKDRTPEALVRLMRKRGASKEEIATYQKYAKRMRENLYGPAMSEAERKALSYICHVTCHFREVPKEMQRFAKELKESLSAMRRCGSVDPIALGAFAHRKIGEIHPFADGNGRLARALLNAILMEHGLKPVVFSSDTSYTDAVEQDMKEPGYFTRFLQKVAIPGVEKAKDDLPV